MSFNDSPQELITITDSSRPKTPNATFLNPLDARGVYVNLIEVVPSAEFTLKGKLVIKINGAEVFDSQDKASAFTGVGKKQIPLSGRELNRGSRGKIEFFAWNGTDTNTLELLVSAKISESPLAESSSINPIGKDVVNQQVSQSLTGFSKTSRAVGEYTQTLDMKGYDKLILVLSQPTDNPYSNSPTQASWNLLAFDQDALDAFVDGDLETIDTSGGSADQACTLKIDTGSSHNQKPILRIDHATGNSGTVAVVVESSDDDAVWSAFDSYTLANRITFAGSPTNYGSVEGTARYFRWTFTPVGSVTVHSVEIFDSLLMGGTGALSFEVQDDDGNWNEFISSTEFGTISQSDNSIVAQLGGINNIGSSGSPFILPSTQTQFRMKYVVTVGGLDNSISVIGLR